MTAEKQSSQQAAEACIHGGWTPVKAPLGAVIDPSTGLLCAIIQDAAEICGLATSTISRLASEGQIRRFTRFVVLDDIKAIKPRLRGPGRPPGSKSTEELGIEL